MPTPFFIYGTLHPDRAPAEIAAPVRSLTPLGPATLRGTLLDLGEYPGLLLDDAAAPILDEATALVAGHLFAVPDAETLAALDRYEDFRPDDPAASLFLRLQATATLPDGSSQLCWVYIYNGGVYNR